ncbi:MAG: hypothetical protein RLZ10_2168 [Bacteroidota bacterium]|jgi:hypothetical protein
MILSTSKDYNPNYLAQVVVLEQLAPHPQADRLQLANVCGSEVITGLDAKIGDVYVYFPIECVINHKFLSWSKSFSDPELNEGQKEKGFFHKTGRVRMTKLRGIYSNGYIVPFLVVQQFVKEVYGKKLDSVKSDTTFDTICDELFVWKYELPIKEVQVPGVKTKGKIHKFNRVIPGQFAFHPDTKNLRYEILELKPDDYISITKKYHGSNFVVANTLVYKELGWFAKLLFKLGIKISDKEYGLTYSSRTVVKSNL